MTGFCEPISAVCSPAGTFEEPTLDERVERILARLLAAAQLPRPELKIIDGDERLFAQVADGTLELGTSLAPLTDDELAFVIAHELGHLVLHPTTSLRQAVWQRLTHPRQMEHEADDFGRMLAARAGFADGSVRVFRRLLGRDPRTWVRWQVYRRIPLCGGLIVALMRTLEAVRVAHPHTELRLQRAIDVAGSPTSLTWGAWAAITADPHSPCRSAPARCIEFGPRVPPRPQSELLRPPRSKRATIPLAEMW